MYLNPALQILEVNQDVEGLSGDGAEAGREAGHSQGTRDWYAHQNLQYKER